MIQKKALEPHLFFWGDLFILASASLPSVLQTENVSFSSSADKQAIEKPGPDSTNPFTPRVARYDRRHQGDVLPPLEVTVGELENLLRMYLTIIENVGTS